MNPPLPILLSILYNIPYVYVFYKKYGYWNNKIFK